jgi:peptidoglycan/LPS O-acetylase OafA/YrhL
MSITATRPLDRRHTSYVESATVIQIAPAPAKHIAGLTSLRFFAAMAVVLYHTLGPFQAPVLHQVWRVSRLGSIGVSMFFILSGFILFYTYERALKTRHFNTRNFFTSRFARIYPVYLLGLILALPGFIAGMSGAAETGGEAALVRTALTAPFLLQSWDPATACRWNCPGWSLGAEAFFYVLFPIIGGLAVQLNRRWLPIALCAVYTVIVALPLGYLLAGLPTHGVDMNTNHDLTMLRFDPLVRLPEFVLGVLVGRTVLERTWEMPAWGAGLAAMTVIAALYGSSYLPMNVSETLVQNGLYAPLFAFLIVAIAKGPSGLLAGNLWVRLGAASYALYIIHIPIWGMFRYAARSGVISEPTQDLPLYICYLELVLCGAILIHRFVEIPAREAILRWSHRHLSVKP